MLRQQLIVLQRTPAIITARELEEAFMPLWNPLLQN